MVQEGNRKGYSEQKCVLMFKAYVCGVCMAERYLPSSLNTMELGGFASPRRFGPGLGLYNWGWDPFGYLD